MTTYKPLTFKFGDEERVSIGIIDVCIPIPDGTHISIKVQVVKADVPMLIGMEIIHTHKVILDFGKIVIRKKD